MRRRPKTKYETKGYKSGCVSYNPCPLCFGCRAHTSYLMACRKCEEDWKYNICNREKHTDKNLSRMITRERIEIGREASARK